VPLAPRLQPLDGLRAIAAGAVALYHFQQRIPHLDAALPRALSIALQHGNLGVQVFFVLSGFAVARSLASGEGSFGRFLLRRAARLDPPYLFVVFCVTLLALRNPSGWPVPPTLSLVFAHAFYLQGLLGMPHLQGVFWTLCIEIQLYCVFGLLFTFARRARSVGHALSFVLVASALVASSLTWLAPTASRHFVPFWALFVLGVAVERADRIPAARAWLAVLSAALFVGMILSPQLETGAGLLTTAVLWLATRSPRVASPLSHRALLALGRGSYSFYLVHALVAGVVFDAIRSTSIASDVLRLTLAATTGVAAAFALHHVIERPAQRIARRLFVASPQTWSATASRATNTAS
jgi:peptidoglycan/LPS O-acetylase OafA/YrhL